MDWLRNIIRCSENLENAGFIDLKLYSEGQRETTHLISLPDVPASAVKEKPEELLE